MQWNFTTVLEDLDFSDYIALLLSKLATCMKRLGDLLQQEKVSKQESARHQGVSLLIVERALWLVVKKLWT